MKKLILTFSLFVAAIFAVNAQDKTANRAAKIVDQINQVCALSQDQSSKLQPIAENYLKTRQANKLQYANDPEGRKNANKIANENYKMQLKGILSPEQIEKLKAYNAQQKANRRGGEEQPEQGGGQQ
jgi:hypothetical protein